MNWLFFCFIIYIDTYVYICYNMHYRYNIANINIIIKSERRVEDAVIRNEYTNQDHKCAGKEKNQYRE